MNSGIFLINKDKGLSSNKTIQKIKRKLDIKKIGHFGTLDPLAEGLLVCGINKGTKLSERFLNLDKSYFSKIMLGIQTTTDDSEGSIIVEKKIQVSKEEIIEMIKTFVGESKQKAPFFSALKYQVGIAAKHVGEESVQLHGGMGVTDETNIGHYCKRLTTIRAIFGNTDYHLKRYSAL